MLRSLRVRLLLWVGLVVLVSVTAVGIVSSLTTRREFEHFLQVEAIEEVPMALDLEEWGRRLQDHHGRYGWDGAPGILEELRQELSEGRHLLLLGPDGRMLFSTEPEEMRHAVRRTSDGLLELTRSGQEGEERREEVMLIRGPEVVLHNSLGQVLGSLYVLPELLERDMELPPPRGRFLQAVNRWLLAAVAAGGLLALLATAAVGRRILGPVEQLTRAVRRLSEGDWTYRVPVQSRDEVGELASAFNQMADHLERQEQLRRQLVTDVAHDLRTPLTNIRGQLEAVQDGLLQPSPEVVASLHEEVMFLSRLVGDLQDLSLAEAGKLRLELQPLQVSAEIRQVLQALLPQSDTGAPVVQTELPDLPPALGDAARFRQIVRNLLSNARTHTPESGRILVRAREVGEEIEVCIEDTGPGIAPEALPHVFERFYRGDRSRARKTGGAGLGLAIVKHLVTVQGGRVWAHSKPGQGSSFYFTLPKATDVTS